MRSFTAAAAHGRTAAGAVLALALLACTGGAVAAGPCTAPGEPIHWIADYCMLTLETDDEIAASACMEREGRRRFRSDCAASTFFKRRMCEVTIRSGTRAGTVGQCVRDPAFQGRTVRLGGVGG